METIQTPELGTEQEQVTPQAGPEMEIPQTPSEEVAEPQVEEPQIEQPSLEPETPAAPDYKQKFVDSQREAILLNERNRVKEAQIETLTKQDTPTDEAMRQLYPEWDGLDEYNKRVLIRTETIAMQNAATRKEQQDILARQRLEDEIEPVMDDPKFSKLKGHESEFKRFALRPANRGLSAEVIAKAFLFDANEEAPPVAGDPPPQPREALPTGSGGLRGPIKPKKISLEEAAQIRKTDHKRYNELLDADAFEEFE
jgi:hypothetical protein